MVPRGNSLTILQTGCFITHPFDEILSSISLNGVAVEDAELLQNIKFTKSAQFWSQNVRLILAKKTSTRSLCF